MNHMTRPWAFLAPILRNVWAVPLACVLVAAFVGFAPGDNAPALHHGGSHPGTCRSCSWSSPRVRAARDAWMIEQGAIEEPNESDDFPEQAVVVARRTPPMAPISHEHEGSPASFFAKPQTGNDSMQLTAN